MKERRLEPTRRAEVASQRAEALAYTSRSWRSYEDDHPSPPHRLVLDYRACNRARNREADLVTRWVSTGVLEGRSEQTSLLGTVKIACCAKSQGRAVPDSRDLRLVCDYRTLNERTEKQG